MAIKEMATMIKFRAWDKVTSIYRKVLEIKFYPDGELKKVKVAGLQRKGAIIPEKLVIEQFTGLTDVNGKDIYEGDILATSSMIYGDKVTDYLKVEWREDYVGFYCGEKPLYACLSEWDNDIKFAQTFPEIIGNVHTNPELLEEI